MNDITHDYPPTAHESVHDVLLTPFMVRVREATTGGDGSATLVFRHSRPEKIAVAVDEWFNMRIRAEHIIAEANAMLKPDGDHIVLEDEHGTGHLSFTLRWRDRFVTVGVDQEDMHSGQIVTDSPTLRPEEDDQVSPADDHFMEELAISLIGLQRPQIRLNEEKNNE